MKNRVGMFLGEFGWVPPSDSIEVWPKRKYPSKPRAPLECGTGCILASCLLVLGHPFANPRIDDDA